MLCRLVYLKRWEVDHAAYQKAVNHGANAHRPHGKGHGKRWRAQHPLRAVRALYLVPRELFAGHACNVDGLLCIRANVVYDLYCRQARRRPERELKGAEGARRAV